jgi:antibiotic biosynthesis monooxygenase (ABM) superfamily enzyme
MTDAAASGPFTTAIERKVVPGREADYELWLQGITAQALQFPGHMGVNVLRPTAGGRDYVSIFRFDSYEHSRAWEESPVRRQWLDKLQGLVEGEDQIAKGTGLEFWFSLPELPAAHPSPHKMALVLLVVVFLLVWGLSAFLLPYIAHWPLPLRVFVTVLGQVLLMTYLVMPRVTRLLQGWLYK